MMKRTTTSEPIMILGFMNGSPVAPIRSVLVFTFKFLQPAVQSEEVSEQSEPDRQNDHHDDI